MCECEKNYINAQDRLNDLQFYARNNKDSVTSQELELATKKLAQASEDCDTCEHCND